MRMREPQRKLVSHLVSQLSSHMKSSTTQTIGNTTTITQTSTVFTTSTSTSAILPRCSAGGPNMRRDVSADIAAKASASKKAQLPAPLRKFKPKALSSACSCMGYKKAGSGSTVTVTVPGASATASVKTRQITQMATTTIVTTVTSTRTATVTTQVAGIDGAKFAIVASDSNTNYDGSYLLVNNDVAMFSANSISSASDFQIDGNNELIEYDQQASALNYANQDLGNPCEPVYFNPSLGAQMVPLTCCIDGASDLQCGNVNGASQFSLGIADGLLYFCDPNKTAQFNGITPVRMAVQLF